jgi:hypothetical protein
MVFVPWPIGNGVAVLDRFARDLMEQEVGFAR